MIGDRLATWPHRCQDRVLGKTWEEYHEGRVSRMSAAGGGRTSAAGGASGPRKHARRRHLNLSRSWTAGGFVIHRNLITTIQCQHAGASERH